MQLSKNKKYQYLFFSILSIYIIFNGGNSNLFIQLNFVLVSLFFLYCLKDKNYYIHLQNFYSKIKIPLIFYLIFLLFLIFQIINFPIEFLFILSPEKYKILILLENTTYSSISFSPSNSFFQILNYLTLIFIVFICKIIFYKEIHKYRFFFFLSLSGFVSSVVAVSFYFFGNPDFLIFENSFYKTSSSGFFINRTIFSIFLLFCMISSLELLKYYDINKTFKKDFFFIKIYIRLFLIFITIGIITSFSRIGNFLLLFTVLSYLINEILFSKSKINSFRIAVILIILFDILILGIYFGSSQIFNRFYFLSDEFGSISDDIINTSRFDIIRFGLIELKNYIFFGYGAGGFENLFKLNFSISSNEYADHVHSDIIEFLGEFGIVGFTLISLSFIKFFFDKKIYVFVNNLLIFYLIIILLFDFSLHTPLIQILFIFFFILNNKSTTRFH